MTTRRPFPLTSSFTFLTSSLVLCSQGIISQGTYTAQQIKIAGIIRNLYLRDFICNLERIYFILLTNFINEKNNFVRSFAIYLLNIVVITC